MLDLFKRFRKKDDYETQVKEVQLSKIDKHLNLMLRESMAGSNRTISDGIGDIEHQKQSIMLQLSHLHKKPLMNPNIPQREIQIMEGNRETYVKRMSQYVASLEIPKGYLELYDYSKKFTISLDLDKATYVLSNFFANEIKAINNDLRGIESTIHGFVELFESHNIDSFKEIQEEIEKINKNLARIGKLSQEIDEHKEVIKENEDKNRKLNERILTITSGTDYRALESFRQEKDKYEEDIKKISKELHSLFSAIDTALRKYYYKNPDRKILKNYLEDSAKALIDDKELEIHTIIAGLTQDIDNIELKDKKKEHVIDALGKLTMDFLRQRQDELWKLMEERQRIQAKITHNSASLNLSEQQYWINTNNDKINQHESLIEKLNLEIKKIKEQNGTMKKIIRDDLEKIYKDNVKIVDDINGNE